MNHQLRVQTCYADILTCHRRKCSGVINNINNEFVLFKRPSKPWQCEPACTIGPWNWSSQMEFSHLALLIYLLLTGQQEDKGIKMNVGPVYCGSRLWFYCRFIIACSSGSTAYCVSAFQQTFISFLCCFSLLLSDTHTHSKAAQIFTLSQLTESKARTPNHRSTAGLDHWHHL